MAVSPTFFYDTRYRNPCGVAAYEYSRLDPTGNVDYSSWFYPDMVDHGLVTDEGMRLVEQYRKIPGARYHGHGDIGIEIDNGPSLPALFVPLTPANTDECQSTLDGMADLMGRSHITMPPVTDPFLKTEEVGIFPSRNRELFRFMVRGPHRDMKTFADANGCVGTDILTQTSELPVNNSALSFDWDGENMTNFTFYSPNIYTNDPWVNSVTVEAHRRIRGVYLGVPHTIIRHVKIGLSPTFPAGYMKAYFTVREQPRV